MRISHATKAEVLLFIATREDLMVSILDLMNQFGYTYWGACDRLQTLKRQGLVEQIERGIWGITDKGISRLTYWGHGKELL